MANNYEKHFSDKKDIDDSFQVETHVSEYKYKWSYLNIVCDKGLFNT
jgi:hypothetical protein